MIFDVIISKYNFMCLEENNPISLNLNELSIKNETLK
jgi:hypothetical protein